MSDRTTAEEDPARMVIRIVGIGVLMTICATVYLAITDGLNLHLVVPTLLGLFFSVLWGCGLFALSSFSDKSGHDRSVADATRESRGNDTARG